MKKLLFLTFAMAFSLLSMAQKPVSGAPFSLEGQLGFNASTLSFNSPTLRFRYFLVNQLAVRASFGIASTVKIENFYENEDDNSGGKGTYTAKNYKSNDGWNIALGAEHHFAGTSKLSPYAGLDIKFGGGKQSSKGENSNGISYVANYTEEFSSKFSTLGFNLVAGTDYYFAENFYFGMEAGFGFSSVSVKKAESSVTINGFKTAVMSNPTKTNSFGNNAIGNFRLGWRF